MVDRACTNDMNNFRWWTPFNLNYSYFDIFFFYSDIFFVLFQINYYSWTKLSYIYIKQESLDSIKVMLYFSFERSVLQDCSYRKPSQFPLSGSLQKINKKLLYNSFLTIIEYHKGIGLLHGTLKSLKNILIYPILTNY